MASQQPSGVEGSPRPAKSRSKTVEAGEMAISEFLFDRAGAASPFGDDINLPVAAETLTYRHPTAEQGDH